MRVKQTNEELTLWLSARDTYNWAHRSDAAWPCSTLSGKRLRVDYDSNGDIIDVTINGQDINTYGVNSDAGIDGQEFTACTFDHLPHPWRDSQ